MIRPRATTLLFVPLLLGLAGGCGTPEGAPEPAAISEPKRAEAPSAPVETAIPEPEPEPSTEPAKPAAAAPSAPAPVAKPAARIEVAAAKPGLTRVGTASCKGCHKVQHDSWAAGAHAALDPPLDCESCHGPGSEYKALAIMKDPAKAEEAGLVNPGKGFCTESCHATGWEDGMLARAHAHKSE